jgi:hypothetical protein
MLELFVDSSGIVHAQVPQWARHQDVLTDRPTVSRDLTSASASTLRNIKAGVPQGFVLSPTLYNLYINDIPQTAGVNLALFADDTSLYATEHREGCSQRTSACTKSNDSLV